MSDDNKLQTIGLTIIIGLAITAVIAQFYGFVELRVPETVTFKRAEWSLPSSLASILVSWAILFSVNIIAIKLIKELLIKRKDDDHLRRANYFAIVIGLLLIFLLLKQPYLEMLFANTTPEFWFKALVYGGSTGVGWASWYLRKLKQHGEFFEVLLLTLTAGFTWYARLTEHEDVQYTAVSFLLGSLLKLAFDNLEAAKEKREKQEAERKARGY